MLNFMPPGSLFFEVQNNISLFHDKIECEVVDMAEEKLGEDAEERYFAIPVIITKKAWVQIEAKSYEHAEWLGQGINLGVNPVPELKDVGGWEFDCMVEDIEEIFLDKENENVAG